MYISERTTVRKVILLEDIKDFQYYLNSVINHSDEYWWYKREWVATAFAYKRASIFNLDTRRFYYKLPSTMYRSLRFQLKLDYIHFVCWLQDIWCSIKSLFI